MRRVRIGSGKVESDGSRPRELGPRRMVYDYESLVSVGPRGR